MTDTDKILQRLEEIEARIAVPKLAYSVAEAAIATTLGERTIHRLIEDKKLATCKINGRVLILAGSLERFLTENETKAAG